MVGRQKSVLVVILGDLGHSPRMIQHIQELIRNGFEVDCIAYQESTISLPFMSSVRFHFHPLPILSSVQKSKGWHLIFLAMFKVIMQFFILLYFCLFKIARRPNCILNQNPPSLPLLLILPFVSFIYWSTWIIDWHNFGYSIMSLSHGDKNILVRLARCLEYSFGRLASHHLSVTKALKDNLVKLGNFDEKRIVVCYDHPSMYFKKCSIENVHHFFTTFLKGEKYQAAFGTENLTYQKDKIFYTPFTKAEFQAKSNSPTNTNNPSHPTLIDWRSDRPALLVSSTSWTFDENFDILFDAIDIIESKLNVKKNGKTDDSLKNFPKVIIIITGKGPLRDQYMNLYKTKNWRKFSIISDWLEYTDYGKLLGCAELGISMHASSSGLDFPMKVIDMLGCSLPVLARNFSNVREILRPEMGYIFDDALELSRLLIKLLVGFPQNDNLLALQRYCEKETLWEDSWSEHWTKNVKPLFTPHTTQLANNQKKIE